MTGEKLEGPTINKKHDVSYKLSKWWKIFKSGSLWTYEQEPKDPRLFDVAKARWFVRMGFSKEKIGSLPGKFPYGCEKTVGEKKRVWWFVLSYFIDSRQEMDYYELIY